ncbi:fas-associated death domain protein isoform X2 [Drosophila willistoni]|uniref:fas-associated death domain protein isoform X2 n=1 Tax=Drosophila willistoni TaxID=7260 RepID=UPI000C26C69B|nr:fas-associated death domain protein isoform X2 [Drosophila willistoni]
MSSHLSYDILKKMLEAGEDCNIEFLKDLLAHEIGSVRRLDQIHTLEDLIACLENNDELNEENVQPLKKMTKNQETLQQINAYQPIRVQHPVQPVPMVVPTSVQQNYVTPAAFSENKRVAVFKKISEQLGRSWRDLGRQLNISEGAMDDMEERYPRDLKSRILYLLKMAEEDEVHDPRQFLKRLCRGLSGAGRNDLRNRVEDTMSH